MDIKAVLKRNLRAIAPIVLNGDIAMVDSSGVRALTPEEVQTLWEADHTARRWLQYTDRDKIVVATENGPIFISYHKAYGIKIEPDSLGSSVN